MSDQLIINDPSEKTGRGKQILGILMILLVLALGISIGSLTTDRAGAAGPGDSQLEMPSSGKPTGGPLQAFSQAFEEVSKSVSPAVVNINTEEIISGQQGRSGVPDIFDFFGPFGGPTPSQPRDFVQNSLGSGVIVDPKGYIITNNHVIEGATRIKVNIGGNLEEYTARIIGADPEGDIAVIKIDGDKPFPYARIGNSQNMKVGDWVVAIGSPFGLEQTVTAGIISATGRTFSRAAGEGPSRFSDYLQTDASINRGNSGGPLVNMNGEVVGINSFITNPRSASNAGIGFAVPSHIFVRIYNQILETGRFSRGWLGVGMNGRPFTPALAAHFGVKQGSGALVTQLFDENSRPSDTAGPAAKAGVRPDDVIIEFDGVRINDNQDLTMAVANTVPGKTVRVRVVRFGEEKTFDVVLAERTVDIQDRQIRGGNNSGEEQRTKPKPEIGLEFDNVPPRMTRALNISGGALVTSVRPGSLSDDAGLEGRDQRSGFEGDVIVAANGKPVNSGEDLLNIVKGVNSGSHVVIKFLRLVRQNETIVGYTSFIKP